MGRRLPALAAALAVGAVVALTVDWEEATASDARSQGQAAQAAPFPSGGSRAGVLTGAGAAPAMVVARAPTAGDLQEARWRKGPARGPDCPVFVMVENMLADRRELLRQTWLGAAEPVLGKGCIKMIVPLKDDAVPADLAAEADRHGDVVFLPGNPRATQHDMQQQGMRHRIMFGWAVRNIRFDYVVKVDDDVYTCLPRVVDILSRAPRERLVWGRPMMSASCGLFQFHSMHPDPNFLALSRDMALHEERQDDKQLRRAKAPMDHIIGVNIQGSRANYYWDQTRLHQTSAPIHVSGGAFGCEHHIHIHRVRGATMQELWDHDQEAGHWHAVPDDPIGLGHTCPVMSWYPPYAAHVQLGELFKSHFECGVADDIPAALLSPIVVPKTAQPRKYFKPVRASQRVFLAVATEATREGRTRRAAFREMLRKQCTDTQCDLADVFFFVREADADPAALAGEGDVLVVADDGAVAEGVDDERVLAVWRWAMEADGGADYKWFGHARDTHFVALPRLLREAPRMHVRNVRCDQLVIWASVPECVLDLARLNGPLPQTDFVLVTAAAVQEVVFAWPPKITTSLARLIVMSLADMKWQIVDDPRILGAAPDKDCALVVDTDGTRAAMRAARDADAACMAAIGDWMPYGPDLAHPDGDTMRLCPPGFWAIPSETHAGQPVDADDVWTTICLDPKNHAPPKT